MFQLTNQLVFVTAYRLLTQTLTLFDDSALNEDKVLTDLIQLLLQNQIISELVIEVLSLS